MGKIEGMLHQITSPPTGKAEAGAESHMSPPAIVSHDPNSISPKRTQLLDPSLVSFMMTYVEMSGLT